MTKKTIIEWYDGVIQGLATDLRGQHWYMFLVKLDRFDTVKKYHMAPISSDTYEEAISMPELFDSDDHIVSYGQAILNKAVGNMRFEVKLIDDVVVSVQRVSDPARLALGPKIIDEFYLD